MRKELVAMPGLGCPLIVDAGIASADSSQITLNLTATGRTAVRGVGFASSDLLERR